MRLESLLPRALLPGLVLLGASTLSAQLVSPDPQNPGAGYTLRANSRIVLSDITVTDKDGNPIHNLKASDFKILDNGQPQTLLSFEEHSRLTTQPSLRKPLPPGLYNNEYLIHPPPVLNIILLDLSQIYFTDQAFLHGELTQFIKALPPDQEVAVYLVAAPANILIQSYTSDHASLFAAVDRVLPRLMTRAQHVKASEYTTMKRLLADLGSLPGRKNVLWFSGGFSEDLLPDGSKVTDASNLKPLFDDLERSRIALYPVDARGLTLLSNGNLNRDHFLMRNMADATGGRAVIARNNLALEASHIVATDGDFYTLAYVPKNFVYDSKWHKLKVQLPTQEAVLSYRSGYFADGGTGASPVEDKPRKRLLADGSTTMTSSNRGLAPLIFQAAVRPASEAELNQTDAAPFHLTGDIKGKPFSIYLAVPASELSLGNKDDDGWQRAYLDFSVTAISQTGTIVAADSSVITLSVRGNALETSPDTALPFTQHLELGEGDLYLIIKLVDAKNRRAGALQIPLHIPLPPLIAQAIGTP